MSAQYVVVTGSVGAGATTVANVISKYWATESFMEGKIEVLNPFFRDSQDAPDRWAFHSQAYFLAASSRRHRRIRELLTSSEAELVIEDRTPFEHHGAYSRALLDGGALSSREYALLGDLATEFERGYVTPAVLIYREMSDDQIVERVQSRGREGESSDGKKLRMIHAAFEAFIGGWSHSPIVRIPADADVLSESGEACVVEKLSTHFGAPSL